MLTQNEACEACVKIRCRNCGWEPNDKELEELQRGALTKCPTCKSEKQ